MYDFVLFEYTTAINHEKDVELIAKMMQAGGLNVAIAEVYNEKAYCKDKSIPHISFKRQFKYRFLSPEDEPNTLIRVVRNQILVQKYERYMEYVAEQLNGTSKNIYAGSHSNNFSFSWIKKLSQEMKVYLWGLRSYRLYEHKINPFSIVGVYSYFNRKYFYQYPNVRFFVSDEMIKQEYIDCKIPKERLVIRRERTIPEINVPSINRNNSKLRLLTIGSIRPEKQVEIIIRAINKISSSAVEYIIAGKTDDKTGYESVIRKATGGMSNVIRINHRLSEEEFKKQIEYCDFLILCDKQQPSNVTNGTMNEALLSGKPIIAPNYNPYRYIVEKYCIGILFDPADEASLIKAICDAMHKKTSSFREQLIVYQKSLLFDSVAKEFCTHLR